MVKGKQKKEEKEEIITIGKEEIEEVEFLDEDVYRKVPEKDTYSGIHFLMIFIGMWTSLAAIGAGVDLGATLIPWHAITGLFLGYMICLVFGFLVGRIGVKRRLATYPLLERPFSRTWAILPTGFSFLIASVFIGVQADAITRIAMNVVGVDIVTIAGPISNRAVVAVILTALMMFTAYRGIKYIRNLSWISIPLYLSVLVIGVYLAVNGFEGTFEGLLFGEGEPGFEQAAFMGVALYAGFSAMISDVSRFVKNTKHFTVAIIIGYIAATFIPISGVLIGASEGVVYWQVFTLWGLAFGVYAAGGLFLAQWTTNDNNAFTAGLALSTASGIAHRRFGTKRLGRRLSTIIPIVIGIILAGVGSGAIGPLIAAVIALGSWLPPMAGVLIAHYYIVEYKADEKGLYTKGFAGVISWAGISIIVHLGLVPWGALVGIIGSFLLYIVLYYGLEAPILGKARPLEEYEEEILE